MLGPTNARFLSGSLVHLSLRISLHLCPSGSTSHSLRSHRSFHSRSTRSGEAFALRSWGCFVLAVAGIVHAAPYFPLTAQRRIGASLAGCFLLLTGLYGHAVLAMDFDPAYRVGIAGTGSVFAGLLVAYAGALVGGGGAGGGGEEGRGRKG